MVKVCGDCSEELESKYSNKLTREMSGPEYEIIGRIMKTLVNKKITVPGSFIGYLSVCYGFLFSGLPRLLENHGFFS